MFGIVDPMLIFMKNVCLINVKDKKKCLKPPTCQAAGDPRCMAHKPLPIVTKLAAPLLQLVFH